MKKLVIVLFIVAIGVAGYFTYQYFTGTETQVTASQVTAPELPATTESASKEPLNFKRKWNVGEKKVTQLEIISETDMQASNNQPAMKMNQHITEDLALTTVSTRPDGGYAVDFQIDRFKMEMDMNTVKIVMDSNSESTSLPDKQMGDIFKAIVGKKLTMLLGPEGKVDSVLGIEEFVDGLKTNSNSPAGKIFANTFNELYFKNMMEGFCDTSTIPQRPIQVGESWPVSREMDIPMMGKIKLELTNTFTGWKEYDGVTCALVNSIGTMKSTSSPDSPQAGMKMNIKDTQFKGYTFVDPVKGVTPEFSLNQNMVMEMTVTMPTKNGPKEQKSMMTTKQQTTGKIISVEKVGEETPFLFSTDSSSPAAADKTSKP